MTHEDVSRALAHEPIGKPGGPGVWGMKGKQYPAYFQHIRNDLIQSGHTVAEAHRLAWGILRNFAQGHDGHGNAVHPDTQAKAVAALAEMKRLEAEAKVSRTDLGRFNPNHAPAGAGGGEFTSAPGAGGGREAAAQAHAAHQAHEAHLAHVAHEKSLAHLRADPVQSGETGQRVSDVQARLDALGANLARDGKFGPKTLAAVREFQRTHKDASGRPLKVDGLVGPLTMAALAAAHPAKRPAHHATKKVTRMSNPLAAMPMALAGYDADGLDGSWDDPSGLPDLAGLDVPDFEAADGGDVSGVSRASAAPLGTGARFAALKGELAARGAVDPGALAAWIGRKKYGREKFHALARAARRAKGGRGTASRADLFRSYPLEDFHVLRAGEGDSSGRVIEAYATVFGEPAEIRDSQGHYEEEIDRSAFNKRIADLERSRSGFGGAKVFYNHGMTIHGTASDRYSMPIAVCESVRAEARGLITRARYLDTPLGNEVLEMWRSGAITAQSFTGAVIRSSPELARGQRYGPRNGQLTRVRRLELGLKEFGPTPFPYYAGAELVGVRMSPLGSYLDGDEEDYPEDDAALPPDAGAAPGEPPLAHSARSHQHVLYAVRSREALDRRGIRHGHAEGDGSREGRD